MLKGWDFVHLTNILSLIEHVVRGDQRCSVPEHERLKEILLGSCLIDARRSTCKVTYAWGFGVGAAVPPVAGWHLPDFHPGHRLSTGTPRRACSMCIPHPFQEGLPQVGQSHLKHIWMIAAARGGVSMLGKVDR